jgi:hypothetical protein
MPHRSPLAHVLSKGLLLAAAMLAGISLASLAHAEHEPHAEGEPGTWQNHETELDYMGFTTTYSCDGLQTKLELLLRQLGARQDAKVNAFGCDRGFGVPSRFARATLKFATLQPDTATATATAVAGASPAVPGSWRQVELAPHRPFGLEDGDCELMEQFRDKVLPLFATRALQNRTQCVPHQDTGGPFSLQLQVFAPVRAAKSK